jgi:hypothetical protein
MSPDVFEKIQNFAMILHTLVRKNGSSFALIARKGMGKTPQS